MPRKKPSEINWSDVLTEASSHNTDLHLIMTPWVSIHYLVKFDFFDKTHHPEYRSESMKGAQGCRAEPIASFWTDQICSLKNIMGRTKMFECGRMFSIFMSIKTGNCFGNHKHHNSVIIFFLQPEWFTSSTVVATELLPHIKEAVPSHIWYLYVKQVYRSESSSLQ